MASSTFLRMNLPDSAAAGELSLSDRQAALGLTVTRYVGILAVVLSTIMFNAWLLFRSVPQLLAYSLAIIPITAASFLYPYLHRRGRARLGGILFIGGVFLTLNATPLLMPEFILVSAIASGAMILLSFMLLGSRVGKWLIVAAVLGLAENMLVNQYFPLKLFSAIDAKVLFFINLFSGPFVTLAVGIMVWLVFIDQEKTLAKLQQANKWLDTAAEEAGQGRARLEQVIQQYEGYMAQVSKGNLRAQLALDGGSAGNEPILALGKSLSAMTGNLHGMILKIKEASRNISTASSEILAANTQQVASATQTSASIAQTTTTVEELKSLADHALSITAGLAESAQRTVEVSQGGRQSVDATIQAMLEIRGRVESIAGSILALSEKTQQIGDIITMVSDLASQSNMLALNASIEASRAGEAGKGFGVVAQEMRTLAEQSRRATAQIKEILSEIQAATNSTVMATEEGSKTVERGVKQAEAAQRSIEQLAGAIEQSDQMAQQINAGGRQQLVGVEQVATTMQHINQATTQNVASSRQTESAARNLNELAQSLEEEIARYKV